MDDEMQLRQYVPRSELITEEHPIERSRFPAIDAHNHLGSWVGKTPAEISDLVAEMDACNLKACLDLDGNRSETLSTSVRRLKDAHPGRFYILTVVPWEETLAQGGDVGEKLANSLEQAVSEGADGLKIHKTLGLRLRDDTGKLVMPHDERLAPLFARCGQLGVPCLIHVADPVAFFRPLDRYNERWEELSAHPTWHFHGDEYPAFEELMESQERLLEQHPGTVFQSAHVASASEDLGYVSSLLDRYRNLHVDISARISELGRQPRAAREWFLKYADRILYGTDVSCTAAWQRVFMRFLETRDEHFAYGVGEIPSQGRWRISGVGLPDEVLEMVYYKNAERLYGESPSSARACAD